MPTKWFGRIALMALLFVLIQATWGLAGTTGTLTGSVVLSDGAPFAGASVTATSPSESVSTKTDASGHFTFVSLIPDTYAVTVSKDGYQSVTQSGVTVIADNSQNVAFKIENTKVLRRIVSTANVSLIRPGTTADVYSVNGVTASKATALGGGGGLDNAYSAIASLPGAYVPQGQSGWFQAVYIRGGDFDQVGYEFDGVPVNRSFDNYPTSNASALGQQELQVYTGSSPANSEGQGLAGFINQVIKTGTYPGFGSASLGIGSPTLYNKVNLEIGGATPNRNFSYFLGVGGYDQAYRYYDNNNGASISSVFGVPFDLANGVNGPAFGGSPGCGTGDSQDTGCYANTAFFGALPAGPGGYILAPFNAGSTSRIKDRENVLNLHLGLPHRNDAGKDDIQLLYDASELYTYSYSSYNDYGGKAFWNGIDGTAGGFNGNAVPIYFPGSQYTPPLLQAVTGTAGAINGVIPYAYPNAGNAGLGGAIPATQQDGQSNGQGILKLQFQHNIGSNAYFRLYGYTYYSDWLIHSPALQSQNYIGNAPDYELWTHTRGLSATFADQVNSQNLLTLEASYVTASTVRDNNTQMLSSVSGTRARFAVAVDSNNPLAGICYNLNGGSPIQASCEPNALPSVTIPTNNPLLRASYLRYTSSFSDISGQTCGTGPCEWLAVENGPYATYNTVKPVFSAASITDQMKASDKLIFNFGLRYDNFRFDLAPTAAGPARAWWFNAWNTEMCVNPLANSGNPESIYALGLTPQQGCAAAGPGWRSATMVNSTANGNAVSYPELQPRFGGTYSLNSDNVIRFSYGRFVQPPNAAYEQYNSLQQNLPNFIGPLWYKQGYNSPERDIRPSVSYNADLSLEHRFPNTETTFKLTPFLRRTQDQVQQFFIDPRTGFISGVNAGRQTSSGVEFQLDSGNFSANGVAAVLSYTYTRSHIRYSPLANGTSLLSPINADIQRYNSYTKSCQGVAQSTDPSSLCGQQGGANAVACFTTGGVPDPSCAAGDVANPYFNAPSRGLLDLNADYVPFTFVPAGLQLTGASYEVPNVASLILNYKHDRWSFTPSFQFESGGRYGAPESQVGIDPATCPQILGGSTTGDPRYPFGAGGGSPYDATACTGSLAIPNQFTGNFDQPGAFVQPSRFTMHMQFAFEASSRATLRLTVANIIDRCSGGQAEPWLVSNGHWCQYGVTAAGIPPVGNFYNPGNTIQPIVQYPYGAGNFSVTGNTQPVQAFLGLDIKL